MVVLVHLRFMRQSPTVERNLYPVILCDAPKHFLPQDYPRPFSRFPPRPQMLAGSIADFTGMAGSEAAGAITGAATTVEVRVLLGAL